MTTLPPETFFVGRDRELADIILLLSNPACRLLTLVGPGGIGKTRLALEVVRQLPFDNDIHFVVLQALASPDFMVSAIAEAVDFHFDRSGDPKQQLLDYFRDKSILLILDNLEHLLDGVSLVTDMLGAAPNLRILVTSRERLNLREEWVLEVSGLSYPEQETETSIESYSAVELFIRHTRRIKVGFLLTETDKWAVIRICRLVGGMPLAIELAAAWVRVLSCQAIADEIEHSFDFLETSARDAEPRHRSMRAVIEPTWNRMTEPERAVFRKVSVFHGGFTREAAEAVADASLQILLALVDRSLLRARENGRYEIHELLRQFGEEQLVLSNQVNSARNDHGNYFTNFLCEWEQDIKGRRQVAALNEIEADFENVRAAWYWLLSNHNYRALDRALETLFHFCEMRSRFQEGAELLWKTRQQLASEVSEKLHTIRERIRVRSLWMLGWGTRTLDDVEAIKAELHECLTIARQQGEPAHIAFCLWMRGAFGHFTRDYARVVPFLEESLALYSDLGDRFYVARAADWLGAVVGATGQMEDFVRLSQYSLDLRRAIGDHFGMAASLINLAQAAIESGQYDQAKHYLQEMEQIYLEIGSHGWMIRIASFLSWIALQQGDFQEARARAEETRKIAANYGGFIAEGMAIAHATLGMLAALEEDYTRSWALCERARYNLRPANSTPEEASAVAACGLENYPAARHYFLEAVNLGFPWHDNRGMTLMLPVAAVLLYHEGQQEQAAEMLGLAFHHPASAKAWMQQWPLLTRLRAQLEAKLGSSVYTSAWERGKHHDLMTVVAGLLNYFQPDESSPSLQAANRNLIEPLTERELEILSLLAEGFSNREIADRLFLAVGTIKAHTSNIFGKLDVGNRTAAVSRARALNLL